MVENSCLTTTYTPTNDDAIPCSNGLYSTQCIINAAAITYLNLPVNSTQLQINTALVTALIAKDLLIAELDTRISALEN